MNTITDTRNPHRTKDIFPDTITHGVLIEGFDERIKDFVTVSPADVRNAPKVFRFWKTLIGVEA